MRAHPRIEDTDGLPRGKLGIGFATELFGLTARAIRFYEDRGLVTSARDEYNVRWYDSDARDRLTWIVALRQADVSLAEIARVLEANAVNERASRALEALKRRRTELGELLSAVDTEIARLIEMPVCARRRLHGSR